MSAEENNNESTINLGDIFRVIWKNIILVAVITVLILAVGIVYTFAIVKPKYSSSATFVVAISEKGTSSGTSSSDYDLTNSLRLIQTVASLVEEDIVLDSVAEQYETTSNSLADMISVSYSTTSFLISVSVENVDRELSKQIANSVVEQLIYVADNVSGFEFLSNTITQTSFAKEGSYSSPNRMLYLAVSLLGGLVISFVVVFVKEFASTRFKTRKDIETVLDERIIGYFIDDKSKISKNLLRNKKKKHQNFDLLAPTTQNYEPYNNLLTNIKYLDLQNSNKVIMITSSHEGELKSTIITNLAACAVNNKQRALIIDLDTRKPVDHKIFKVSKDNGLVEYIDGTCTREKIIKHSQSGVDVITSGKKILNPVVIIEHPKLKELISQLSSDYDYIFVDAPPVMLCSDATSISKLCDSVIFNVTMNDVKKKEAKEALDSLKLVGARILGINVTKGVADKHSSGYYYYNYSYYGNSEQNAEEDALRAAAMADDTSENK